MSFDLYKCPHCGSVTEELRTYKQLLGEFYRETTDPVCGCCRKADYEPAYKCKICGEYTCESELNENYDVCAKCAESLQTYYKAFRKKLSEAEWDYLYNYMEGERFK